MSNRWSRIGIGVSGLLMTYLSLAYLAQMPFIEWLWPWTDYGTELNTLSLTFLSSIAAAIAAPQIWIALTGKVATAAGGALNLAVCFTGIACYLFTQHQADPANARLLPATIILGVSALANLGVFLATRKIPFEDPRPLPMPVRISFGIFIVALWLVGGSLIQLRPNILPWDMTPQGSVIYGWIYLGASIYFLYALARPKWENATGQLLGFLAYDLVLIGPFLLRFSEVPDEQRLSLIVYTSIVVYSGLLASYYLFIHPETRLRRGIVQPLTSRASA